jgi:hypothetical protein
VVVAWLRSIGDEVLVLEGRSLEDVRAWGPQVILNQDCGQAARAEECAARLGVPLVQFLHGSQQLRQVERVPCLVVPCSTEMAAEIRPGLGMMSSLLLLPPILREDYATAGRGQCITLIVARTPASWGADNAASAYYWKGLATFVALAQAFPDERFLLVSGYPHEGSLPPNVEVVGLSPDAREVYARTKVLLVPSLQEAAPRVAVEAAMSRIPVIASDLPGVRETTLGRAAYVPAQDTSAWRSALAAVLRDPGSYRRRARDLGMERDRMSREGLRQLREALAALCDGERPPADRPLLSLVMIVRNEAHGLAETLRRARPIIDRWTVLDTGSTDGTQQVVREELAGVPGRLLEEPFVDFAASRNRALELAGQEAVFALLLDSDDHLERGDALRAFCRDERDRVGWSHEAYDVRQVWGPRVFLGPRLVRMASGWRYVGRVHEYLVRPGRPAPVMRVPEARLVHVCERRSAEASRARWTRDLEILRAEVLARPDDPRAVFYLGQTCECLGRHDEALQAYRRRAELSGWAEETFEARLRCARCMRALGHPWHEVQTAYLDAFACGPDRAEPLYEIALHWHEEDNHALTFLFAHRAALLPYPRTARLFVDADVYQWKAADLVGVSAYYVGEREIGRQMAARAARARPDDPRLRRNLEFYAAGPPPGQPAPSPDRQDERPPCGPGDAAIDLSSSNSIS